MVSREMSATKKTPSLRRCFFSTHDQELPLISCGDGKAQK